MLPTAREAKKSAENQLPPRKEIIRKPLAAAREWAANPPAVMMDRTSDTFTPPLGLTNEQTSRVMCPPSSGQIGSKLKIGQRRLITNRSHSNSVASGLSVMSLP